MTTMTLLMIWFGIYTIENMIRVGYDFSIFKKNVESITMYIEPAVIICIAWMEIDNLLFSVFSGLFIGLIFYWFAAMFSFMVLETLKLVGISISALIGYDVSYSKKKSLDTLRIVILVLNVISFIVYLTFLIM